MVYPHHLSEGCQGLKKCESVTEKYYLRDHIQTVEEARQISK